MISPFSSEAEIRSHLAHAPTGSLPGGWQEWSVVRAVMPKLAREFVSTLRPDVVGAGPGIVTSAGPKHFPALVVMLRGLRIHNCTLPVEVWHLGPQEMDPSMKRILHDLGATTVDAKALEHIVPWRTMGGWQLKPYAILNSHFEEVLWLDADNEPLANPEFLFECQPYLDTGAVFWPDCPTWHLRPDQFEAFGLGPLFTGPHYTSETVHETFGTTISPEVNPPLESGQLLIHKGRCWKELALANWWCDYSDYTFHHLHGDKETFRIAWTSLGTNYALPRYWPDWEPRSDQQTGAYVQHGFDGTPLFKHKALRKELLHQVPGLSKQWSGTVWQMNGSLPGPQDRQIRERLCRGGWRYKRTGLEDRRIEFLLDGHIGFGSKALELTWAAWSDGGVSTLGVSGRDGLTFVATADDRGMWSGRWLIHDRCAIELVPDVLSNNPEPVVTDSIPIKLTSRNLPGAPGVRGNASLLKDKDKTFLLAYRNGQEGTASDVWVQRLTKAFDTLGPPKRLDLRHPKCGFSREDPRLFWHNGVKYVSFTGVEGNGPEKANVLYARLTDSLDVDETFYPHLPERQEWEKNWQFFSHQSRLYCVYATHPWLVLEIEDTRIVNKLHPDPVQQLLIQGMLLRTWLPGTEIRGGAPPVRVGDEYWHVFHSRLQSRGRWNYFAGLMALDTKPPFVPTRMLDSPLIWPQPATNNFWGDTSYPCGAVVTDVNLIVSCGAADEWIEVHKFKIADLDRRMGVPCENPVHLTTE